MGRGAVARRLQVPARAFAQLDDGISHRVILLGLAIALQNVLEAPREPLLAALGPQWTATVVVGALTASLYLIWRALGDRPPGWRWLRSPRVRAAVLVLTLLGALFGLRALGSIVAASFQAPFYPNDGTTLDHYAAQETLHGRNPYVTTDIVAAIREFRQDPIHTTPLRRGQFGALAPGEYPSRSLIREVFARQPVGRPDDIVEFETHVSYPALCFLPLIPFVWLGLPSVVPFYALCLLAYLVALIFFAPAGTRLWLGLLGLASVPLLDATIAGSLDVQWIALMFVAWRWPQRFWLTSLALGLALASKQLAWFFAPYYAIYLWRAYGPKAAFSRVGIACLVFAFINLPFLIANPGAWWRGVLAPQVAPMFPAGSGLVRLSLVGLLPLVPQWVYTALEVLGIALGLVWYWRRGWRTPETAFLLAVAPLFFAWRSLTTYFYYVGLPALALRLARTSDSDSGAIRRLFQQIWSRAVHYREALLKPQGA